MLKSTSISENVSEWCQRKVLSLQEINEFISDPISAIFPNAAICSAGFRELHFIGGQ